MPYLIIVVIADPDLHATAILVVYNGLVLSHVMSLGDHSAAFVRYAFAHFEASGDAAYLDEPLMTIMALRYLKDPDYPEQPWLLARAARRLYDKEIPQHKGAGWEQLLAVYMAYAFSEEKEGKHKEYHRFSLSEIFKFQGKVPEWAKEPASLACLSWNNGSLTSHAVDFTQNKGVPKPLGCLCVTDNTPSYGIKEDMEIVAVSTDPVAKKEAQDRLSDADAKEHLRKLEKSREEVKATAKVGTGNKKVTAKEMTSRWFGKEEHAFSSAILFPDAYLGPDLILVARLPDGRLILIAIQAKFRPDEALKPSLVKYAMESLTKFTEVSGYYLLQEFIFTLITVLKNNEPETVYGKFVNALEMDAKLRTDSYLEGQIPCLKVIAFNGNIDLVESARNKFVTLDWDHFQRRMRNLRVTQYPALCGSLQLEPMDVVLDSAQELPFSVPSPTTPMTRRRAVSESTASPPSLGKRRVQELSPRIGEAGPGTPSKKQKNVGKRGHA